jgi:hypothetical protein
LPALPVPVAALTIINKGLATALQNMEEGGKQARADLDAAISIQKRGCLCKHSN